MRIIKIILMLLGLCVVAGAIGVGYLWYSLASLGGQEVREGGDTSASVKQSEASSTPEGLSGSKTISVSQLTDGQRAMLEKLGIDTTSFTLTSSMVSCAEKAVGKDRIAAFEHGATPSFSESLALLPCLRQ